MTIDFTDLGADIWPEGTPQVIGRAPELYDYAIAAIDAQTDRLVEAAAHAERRSAILVRIAEAIVADSYIQVARGMSLKLAIAQRAWRRCGVMKCRDRGRPWCRPGRD